MILGSELLNAIATGTNITVLEFVVIIYSIYGNASLSFGMGDCLLSFGRIVTVCTCNHVSIREKQGNQ
jgi:hypothetical protein